jgi:hypothetical protein
VALQKWQKSSSGGNNEETKVDSLKAKEAAIRSLSCVFVSLPLARALEVRIWPDE